MRLNLYSSPWSESLRRAVVCVLLSGLLAGCGGGESQALVPASAVPPILPGPDPLLTRQWHLFNTGQGGGVSGKDLGLQGVAETGRGVLIAFIDGAVQIGQSLRSALSLGADIVNNSWGTFDAASGQGASYSPADPAWRQALEEALASGRQGQGVVVVFAAGNGGRQDDSNRDGYANHPGVLAVAAVDAWGGRRPMRNLGPMCWCLPLPALCWARPMASPASGPPILPGPAGCRVGCQPLLRITAPFLPGPRRRRQWSRAWWR